MLQVIEVTSVHASDVEVVMRTIAAETEFMMYELVEIPNPARLKQRLRRLQKNKSGVAFLAYDESSPAGYALLARGQLARNQGVGEVVLGVCASNQTKGVGSALMDALIDWAGRQSMYRLELDVHTDNHEAVRLYIKFGFSIEGVMRRRAHINGRYVNKYKMALLL